MKNRFLSAALAVISFGAFSITSNATVIDFNVSTSQWWINSYTESGFQFSLNVGEGMAVLEPNDMPGLWFSNDTGHLLTWSNYNVDSGFALAASNGGSFSLQSLEFANGYVAGSSPTAGLTVTGLYSGGGSIQQSVSYSSVGYQTVTFGSGWTNLSSVLVDSQNANNRTAFDNIVVNSTSAVPDTTATLSLMILSLAGLAAFRHRTGRALRTTA